MNKQEKIQEVIKNIFRDYCEDKEIYHRALMLALIKDVRENYCNPEKQIITMTQNFLYLFEHEEKQNELP